MQETERKAQGPITTYSSTNPAKNATKRKRNEASEDEDDKWDKTCEEVKNHARSGNAVTVRQKFQLMLYKRISSFTAFALLDEVFSVAAENPNEDVLQVLVHFSVLYASQLLQDHKRRSDIIEKNLTDGVKRAKGLVSRYINNNEILKESLLQYIEKIKQDAILQNSLPQDKDKITEKDGSSNKKSKKTSAEQKTSPTLSIAPASRHVPAFTPTTQVSSSPPSQITQGSIAANYVQPSTSQPTSGPSFSPLLMLKLVNNQNINSAKNRKEYTNFLKGDAATIRQKLQALVNARISLFSACSFLNYAFPIAAENPKEEILHALLDFTLLYGSILWKQWNKKSSDTIEKRLANAVMNAKELVRIYINKDETLQNSLFEYIEKIAREGNPLSTKSKTTSVEQKKSPPQSFIPTSQPIPVSTPTIQASASLSSQITQKSMTAGYMQPSTLQSTSWLSAESLSLFQTLAQESEFNYGGRFEPDLMSEAEIMECFSESQPSPHNLSSTATLLHTLTTDAQGASQKETTSSSSQSNSISFSTAPADTPANLLRTQGSFSISSAEHCEVDKVTHPQLNIIDLTK